METNSSAAADAMATKMLETKFKHDLHAMKTEIDSLKKFAKEARKIKEDLKALKEDFEAASKSPEGKTTHEQASMRKIIESVASPAMLDSASMKSETSTTEWYNIKKELAVFETQKRKEIERLKLSFEAALRASEGKTMDEVDSMRGAISVIDVPSLQNMSYSELSALKREIEDRKAQSLRKGEMTKHALPTEQVPKKETRSRKSVRGWIRTRKRNQKPEKVALGSKDSLRLDSVPLLSCGVQKTSKQPTEKKFASCAAQYKTNLKKSFSVRKSCGQEKVRFERPPAESAATNRSIKADTRARTIDTDSTKDSAKAKHFAKDAATKEAVNQVGTVQAVRSVATELSVKPAGTRKSTESIVEDQSVNSIIEGERSVKSSAKERSVKSPATEQSVASSSTEQSNKSSSSEQRPADSELRESFLASKRSSFNKAHETTLITPGREADTSLIECVLGDASNKSATPEHWVEFSVAEQSVKSSVEEQSVKSSVAEQSVKSSATEHWVKSSTAEQSVKSTEQSVKSRSATDQSIKSCATQKSIKSATSGQRLAAAVFRKPTPFSKRSRFDKAEKEAAHIVLGTEAYTSLVECDSGDAEESEHEFVDKESTMTSTSPESSFLSTIESSTFYSDLETADSSNAMGFIADQVIKMTGGGYLFGLQGCNVDERCLKPEDSINISQFSLANEDVDRSHLSALFDVFDDDPLMDGVSANEFSFSVQNSSKSGRMLDESDDDEMVCVVSADDSSYSGKLASKPRRMLVEI